MSLGLAVLVVTGLALGFGALLGWAAQAFRVEADPLVEQVDALLPQTQCGQCGFPGCKPYAEAIASGAADINQCPPGGTAGVEALAALLGREPLPLDPERGATPPPQVALIVEDDCIGCTKCIQACPVDAIVGAARMMHTVLAARCTGCELCIPPCPVDCIVLAPAPVPVEARRRPRPAIPSLLVT